MAFVYDRDDVVKFVNLATFADKNAAVLGCAPTVFPLARTGRASASATMANGMLPWHTTMVTGLIDRFECGLGFIYTIEGPVSSVTGVFKVTYDIEALGTVATSIND